MRNEIRTGLVQFAEEFKIALTDRQLAQLVAIISRDNLQTVEQSDRYEFPSMCEAEAHFWKEAGRGG